MKRLGLCFALGAVLLPGLCAQSLPYRIAADPGSKFELIVRKTGLMSGKEHLFSFPNFSGQLDFNEADPEQSSLRLRIDATTLLCTDDWVSEGDRKKVLDEANNMLQVAKYKDLLFESKSIRKQADGSFLAEGDLSIRGTPKPVTVKVSLNPTAPGSLTFTGDSTIDMTAWGLKPPKALLGTVGTEKEMTVRFCLTARR